ncbi:MAG: SDR family NAD(P)-dependent oxidoreductase [Gammaproteobacteria bacterium]|nr:SDR family NAD(P)-dependent oxidoreductase [Gammaproteobacteria bacterium]
MKKILITGGNSGIGYATAELCKAKGYDVTIVGRDPEKVDRAADALKVCGLVADLGRIEDIQAIAGQFDSGLDALVNNAAIAKFYAFRSTYAEGF